ncbi:hypothetical protein L596_016769 [Steinernema carpocapsae]|uniref:Piwi domain-containing protein n=1 Tax=Steinernema carpocapsae TaxID=34508 RepID=A0A4U5NJ18_STECR|nr:hypothetical protein L596_016769 [Steinernema carpocapsae]
MADEVIGRMRQLSICDDPAYALAPKLQRADKKSFVQHVDIVTSYVRINIVGPAKSYRYEVTIEALAEGREPNILTKGPADDGHAVMRRTVCYFLLYAALDKSGAFGTGLGHELPLVYNGQTLVYFAKPLDRDVIQVTLDQHDDFANVPEELLYMVSGNDTVRISLQKALVDSEMDLQTQMFETGQADVENLSTHDRSFRTFLEMATQQAAHYAQSYTSIGNAFFEKDPSRTRSLGDGKIIRPGLTKGVRLIERDGVVYPALVVDARSAAFYKEQNLFLSVKECMDSGDPNMYVNLLSYIDVFPEVRVKVASRYYKDNRKRASFRIKRFTRQTAAELMIGEVTLADLHAESFGAPLQYPDLPCVEWERQGPARFFALETLIVMPDQRVAFERTDARQSAQLQKINTVRPEHRLKNIEDQMRRLHLWGDSQCPVLTGFGISIEQQLLSVYHCRCSHGTCDPVRIKHRQASARKAEMGNGLKKNRYRIPANVKSWALIYRCEDKDVDVVRLFTTKLRSTAKMRGMNVEVPLVIRFSPNRQAGEGDDEVLGRHVNEARSAGAEFIVYVSSKCIQDHDLLKLLERRRLRVTQHISLESVRAVVIENKITTLDNIIHKLNVKNGGFNYTPLIEHVGNSRELELASGNVLVIGLDVAHPAPMNASQRRMMHSVDATIRSLEPSSIGIVANVIKNPHAFVGDYHFQTARREAVEPRILKERVKWIFDLLAQNRPEHQRPKHVVYLRDGVSEGQYTMTIRDELGAIREAVREIDPKYRPKFALIIVTKRHNKRFFDSSKGVVGNPLPGTVVDHSVVRTDITEFFLQSHIPILGTVKIPQYDIPVNEGGFFMDELQAFANCLCHSHQIICTPVSLPEPVYAAHEVAKRGHNNFLEFRRSHPEMVPYVDGNVNIIDCEEVTAKLAYRGTPLEAIRFNA